MPGGVRINPQVVKGRWWFLKDSGNSQKPVNRLDLFTGKTSQVKNPAENFSSKSNKAADNNCWGNGKASW